MGLDDARWLLATLFVTWSQPTHEHNIKTINAAFFKVPIV
jgi:hypothetical protein